MVKNREINGTEEIGLVTPTPGHKEHATSCIKSVKDLAITGTSRFPSQRAVAPFTNMV